MKLVDQSISNQSKAQEDVSGFITKKELESGLPFLSSRVILEYMTRFRGYKY